jgi:hypothetical protein
MRRETARRCNTDKEEQHQHSSVVWWIETYRQELLVWCFGAGADERRDRRKSNPNMHWSEVMRENAGDLIIPIVLVPVKESNLVSVSTASCMPLFETS